jgi:sulfite exporter TauE/SafE
VTDYGFYLTAFLIGLGGSVHCLGMCGGIAGSLLFSAKPDVGRTQLLFYYNFGRILSYTLMGLTLGFISQSLLTLVQESLLFLRYLGAIMLLLMGLYISQVWQGLRHFEKLFMPFFAPLKVYSKRFLPLDSAFKAIPYGMVWGWLPCGLIYSTLAWSMSTNSAIQSAGSMFFFGLGTLPGLIAISLTTDTLKNLLSQSLMKKLVGLLVFTYGIVLLYLI